MSVRRMEIGNKIKKCECGCGKWIFYKRHHKYYGIPNYLSGHCNKGYIPHNKGKSYNEIYGEKRAQEIINKQKKSIKETHKNHPEIRKKMVKNQIETKKRKFASGELVSHNKGKIKETYEPLRRASKKISGENHYLYKKSPSEITKKLIKKSMNKQYKTNRRIHHNLGKTKENYEPLRKVSEKLKKNNSMKNPECVRKMVETRMKNRSYICWSKGLTKETDKRLDFERPTKFKKGDERISGKNSSSWKGGISFEPYGKEFNEKLKRDVRKRDNQCCSLCGTHREKLNRAFDVHHINYDKTCNIPQNLISLCVTCHTITNRNRKYWQKFFQELLADRYGYKYSEDNKIIIEIKDVT